MTIQRIVATAMFLSAFSKLAFAAPATLGSHNNPLKFAIVPSAHGATALDSAKPFIRCIEKDSKYFITLQVPNSYIAVSEAMGSHKVDLAFGDISSFLIARKKYDSEAFLQVQRYNVNYYQSMILVRSDSSIKTIKDLDGKKFAYPDASSASGYLLPSIEMKKNKVKFAQEVPTGSMEAAITGLLQNKVDAASAYYNDPDPKTGTLRDARSRLETIYPGIAEKTRIIWLSQHIPNEPVFIRKNLPDDIKDKLRISIPKCIQEHPHSVNNMDTLLPIAPDDNEYENYLSLLESSGLDIAKVFSKEKK